MSKKPVPPHGGRLIELMATPTRKKELKKELAKLISWDLSPKQEYDLGMILNGGFSPLTGFLGKKDYDSVVKDMRLRDGNLWPMPINLDVDEDFSKKLKECSRVALRNEEGIALAILNVTDIWKPDLKKEAKNVYGTDSKEHVGVKQLLENTKPVYIGGSVEGLELPEHHSFHELHYTPVQLRELLEKRGLSRVVGFQTRNPMHRAHYELTKRALVQEDATLLIHPVVGLTKPGDVDHYTRVRCYQAVLPYYPEGSPVILALLPLAMRMAGPREALWHAIIRKNYGCSHFIVGRDHAGPGGDFYGPYDAQNLVLKHAPEVGIEVVAFEEMAYCQKSGVYKPYSEIASENVASISGTKLREKLQDGADIAEWFSFPEVIAELRKTYPARRQRGFTIFFTGLSGSGKSTIAKALYRKLLETGDRPVTLLDGDIIRKYISNQLGFSKVDRDLNVRRAGFVASEITKNRGIAICALISPYDEVRREVSDLISGHGGFVLVHVATPLEICESRDRKGLYAKARQGLITNFTGIDDPYETPANAHIVIDTTDTTPEKAAQKIIDYLKGERYLG